MSASRQRVTNDTTLGELQQLLRNANVRLELCSHRLERGGDGMLRVVEEDAPIGEMFFTVRRLTDFGDRRRSTHAPLRRDLATALDEMIEAEILFGSPLGSRLHMELEK